ncbi:hypothetical protein PSTH1771_14555 [Pseudomonas syringae pv. theae]|uniref:hypothetical protein n=1 Tax=Pseudomonas syringae TaxID=317 RepID=UPI0023CA5DAF|nr:hypothetical protein [Pseudomonas syringae]GKS06249.1 hypothetical protein PSTH1771_14555 [Pseudomonas syringae pv. theae]
MDEYKLYVEDTIGKLIDKDQFEADTLRREPWYQNRSGEKLSQFAVCPACDNPIQLVGLYQLPENVNSPYGKHTTSGIRNIAPLNIEARDNCPYFKPRQHQKSDRKARFDGVPQKIIKLLVEQFDRVVYILEKQTQVVLSPRALRGMLERYRGEQGYLYTGATLRNVPWIFAYMSDATPLFAQKVNGNDELTKAVLTNVPKAKIDSNGRLDTATKGAFIDLKMSFIRHRIIKDSEASGLIESMAFVVSQSLKGELVDVYKDVITFESRWFERLIQMPVDHPYRRMDRIELAREVLGDLL